MCVTSYIGLASGKREWRLNFGYVDEISGTKYFVVEHWIVSLSFWMSSFGGVDISPTRKSALLDIQVRVLILPDK